MTCNKDHLEIQTIMLTLPVDQGRVGRHKCAACAYDAGFAAGYKLEEYIDLKQIIGSLDESQAAVQRHKSPHAAFVKGYFDGVAKYYSE